MKRTSILVAVIASFLISSSLAQDVPNVAPVPVEATSSVPVGPRAPQGSPMEAARVQLEEAKRTASEPVAVRPDAPSGRGSSGDPVAASDVAISDEMLDTSVPATRRNPFLPRLTEEEKAVSSSAARRDRDIREFRSRIRSELMPSILDEVRRELQEERARRESIAETNAISTALAGSPAGAASGSAQSAIPVGQTAGVGAGGLADLSNPLVMINGRPRDLPDATFVACVNGKALYRDKTSILFEQDEDTTTCSR